jgi:DNA replication protein DnaC
VTTTAPPLPADLEAGLRRLKLATFRRQAPELMADAKTQRWAPEDLLRALVEAEVAARDASMAAARLKAACFPVRKSFEDFDFSVSSVPRATLEYLASLEWVRAKENPCFVGPPGTGKSTA